LSRFGELGPYLGEFRGPRGIDFDQSGNIRRKK